MQIITLIYSIILLFFYHPLYQNYTNLMNTSFSFFYYIWCVLLTLSLCLTFFKVTSLKKFIIFLSLFFYLGLILPYHKNYPIFSTLHVLWRTLKNEIHHKSCYQAFILLVTIRKNPTIRQLVREVPFSVRMARKLKIQKTALWLLLRL